MAEYLPLYAPGKAITRTASAAITGGQLVSVSGSGTVAPAGATDIAWLGVAANDAGNGDNVTVFTGGTQRIVTGAGGITAGTLVHSASPGTVVAHTPGTSDSAIVGVALTTATAGNTAEIQMER
jgi:predicted RecA/RadA family phage recombinase